MSKQDKKIEVSDNTESMDFSPDLFEDKDLDLLEEEHGVEAPREDYGKPDEIITPYFREMRNIDLLTPEQELQLGRRIKEAQTAILDLALNFKTCYVPLRSFQKEFRGWRRKKKTSREPIEFILQQIDTVVKGLEAMPRIDPDLNSFVKQYQQHHEELDRATREMVSANLRLAVNIAKRYAHRGLALPDLIQEGNLGLMKAVARFDYKTGNRFSTFASWWIRQTISRALSDQGRTIRIPVHFLEIRNAFYRTYFELLKELRREPTIKETSERSGLSIDKIISIIQVSREPVSLDTPISEDGDLLGDLIENEDAVSPLTALQDDELNSLTEAALSTLSPREQQILSMRFGLGDEEVCTLEEVGQTLNISRERVRQLEKRALKRLRHSPVRHRLKNYIPYSKS